MDAVLIKRQPYGSRGAVLLFIRQKGEVSMKEIRESLEPDYKYNTLKNAVLGLTNKGWILRVHPGLYRIKK